MKKIAFSLVFTFILFYSFAQIRVNSNGKIIVGTETPNQDPYNVIKLQVFGPGSVGSKARIAIGDYGQASTGSSNVWIGESGNTDSDKLRLHGAQGIDFSTSAFYEIIRMVITESGLVGIGLTPSTYKLEVSGKAKIDGVVIPSDARLKTNVKKFNNSLSDIQKLNGVSYNYLPKEDKTPITLNSDSVSTIGSNNLTDKERYRLSLGMKQKEVIKEEEHFGFIAQEMQKVFPQLVFKDSTGMLGIDYMGLIPVIVEALKEQSTLIEEKNTEIISLEKRIEEMERLIQNSNKLNESVGRETNDQLKAKLEQNSPNPFNQLTEIGYYLPENTQNAVIYIYNLSGLQIKSIPIHKKDKSSVIINGSELQPGMYIYTLVADSKEIDTKRMILTQ